MANPNTGNISFIICVISIFAFVFVIDPRHCLFVLCSIFYQQELRWRGRASRLSALHTSSSWNCTKEKKGLNPSKSKLNPSRLKLFHLYFAATPPTAARIEPTQAARPNLPCQLVKWDFPATYVVLMIIMLAMVVVMIVVMMMIISTMTKNSRDY